MSTYEKTITVPQTHAVCAFIAVWLHPLCVLTLKPFSDIEYIPQPHSVIYWSLLHSFSPFSHRTFTTLVKLSFFLSKGCSSFVMQLHPVQIMTYWDPITLMEMSKCLKRAFSTVTVQCWLPSKNDSQWDQALTPPPSIISCLLFIDVIWEIW